MLSLNIRQEYIHSLIVVEKICPLLLLYQMVFGFYILINNTR
jgi:hypothetical protein